MSYQKIGEIFLQNQSISANQLYKALKIQKKFFIEKSQWQLLGEILVELEYVKPRTVFEALEQQEKARELNFFEDKKHRSIYSKFKRALDILGAMIGLGITGILFPVIALAIVLDSGSPIFFSQYRVGLRGKQFKIWKFRTMIPQAEREKLKFIASQNYKFFNNRQDPRVTRIGKFLRQTYLDELPQFWNVLKGDMSLVGTRPPTLDEVKAYSIEDWQRLSIKPGITGLWQVSENKNSATFEEVLQNDMIYIQSWSRLKDIQIILKTLLIILLRLPQRGTIVNQKKSNLSKIQRLNIDNVSMTKFLKKLQKEIVFTPTVDPADEATARSRVSESL